MTELKGDATKSRLLAAFVDNTLAIILCLLIASKLPGDLSSGVRWTMAIASYLAYFMIQEAIWQTTLGKRLFGLVVVRLDGSPAGWAEAGWRTLLRIGEVNPILLGMLPGGLMVAFSKRKQRIGDLLAGAVVVRRKDLDVR